MLPNYPDLHCPKDTTNLFYDLGLAQLHEDIEVNDSSQQSENPEFLYKATSIRIPVYKISAIDAVASQFGMTRQDFIMHLVDSSIGSAISGYVQGYNQCSPERPEVIASQFLADIDGISDVAKEYLADRLMPALGIANYFDQNQ